LGNDTEETPIEPTYFYQDSWAFERIVQQKPACHVDVGSRAIFVAFLSKVVPTIMVDIRPLSLEMDLIQFVQGTILDLPFEGNSLESVSSLCVVEHIGLGRYGDPLDPYGSEKAIQELKRVVQPGGDLYISVPLDDENRIYFNAHRAFREEYLLTLFEPFQIMESRYIYGRDFGDQRKPGFGTGCYHLRCAQ
jgi:SAM-dependent methyltransferase